jgi:hypothetical protein
MQRGGGAPSQDGDLTAESIIGAAIPCASNRGSHPPRGPCSAAFAAHARRAGIDGKSNAAGRRLGVIALMNSEREASA